MRGEMSIGPAPANEPCAQVGQPGYAERAREECRRFIDLIRRTVGPEPPGARLRVAACPHEFGTYYEVVVEYDDEDEAAVDYAFRVEREAPATWGG
ncbi:MAG: hypothetical protein K6U87_14365 [Firmicutes bacterium]|nr:hypothetical protein [Bacillota bacterium]